MLYEELHRRYGSHVSQRLRLELSLREFAEVSIDDLVDWLEQRAEKARQIYRNILNNPLASSKEDSAIAGDACKRWRDAEDLAYLVAIADDVVGDARVS